MTVQLNVGSCLRRIPFLLILLVSLPRCLSLQQSSNRPRDDDILSNRPRDNDILTNRLRDDEILSNRLTDDIFFRVLL